MGNGGRKQIYLKPECTTRPSTVDGIIYVMGGELANGISPAVIEAYDPKTGKWIKKAKMPTPRNGLSTAVVNGKIYAIGGSSGLSWKPISTIEIYDPKLNKWEEGPDMLTPRFSHSASVVNGKIYVIGGLRGATSRLSTVEEYTPPGWSVSPWVKQGK